MTSGTSEGPTHEFVVTIRAGLEIPGLVSLVSPSTRHTGIPTSSRVHAEDSSASRFVSCVGGPQIELSMCFFRSSSVDGGEGGSHK